MLFLFIESDPILLVFCLRKNMYPTCKQVSTTYLHLYGYFLIEAFHHKYLNFRSKSSCSYEVTRAILRNKSSIYLSKYLSDIPLYFPKMIIRRKSTVLCLCKWDPTPSERNSDKPSWHTEVSFVMHVWMLSRILGLEHR